MHICVCVRARARIPMGIPGNDTLYSLISGEIYIPTVVSSAHASRTVYIARLLSLLYLLFILLLSFFFLSFFRYYRRYYITLLYLYIYIYTHNMGEGRYLHT